MRKINKEEILATSYKEWIDKLESENTDHPEYSSKHEFYRDVIANLLWVQKGLCAYTEIMLFDEKELNPLLWVEGKFLTKFSFFGHLEHYDESLKKKRGWLWSNLFVAHSDVNSKNKGTKKVKYALKPDVDDYDPFFLLQYNFALHFFQPNPERDTDLQLKTLNDINVLGLNFQPVVQLRKKVINPLIEDVRLKQKTVEQVRKELIQFYTAFEMSLLSLKLL